MVLLILINMRPRSSAPRRPHLAALQAGDITSTGIEPEQVAKFKQMPNIKVYTHPTSGYDLILLNQRNNGWEGLKNKSVRQALSMSISKKSVIDSIRLGFGDPAFSFIPKPSPWYTRRGRCPNSAGEISMIKKKPSKCCWTPAMDQKKPMGRFRFRTKTANRLNLPWPPHPAAVSPRTWLTW